MNTLNISIMDNDTTIGPNTYEVIKLRTGLDVVGMVREEQEGLQVTLPMICQLQLQNTGDTLSTFIPYAPLSADPTLFIPFNHIVHRNNLNAQFIGYYDSASSNWLEMVENGTIPIKSAQEHNASIKEYVSQAMRQVIDDTGGPITDDELRKLEILEDEEFDIEEVYEQHLLGSGKKILH